jgi:hypothetical protein
MFISVAEGEFCFTGFTLRVFLWLFDDAEHDLEQYRALLSRPGEKTFLQCPQDFSLSFFRKLV